jgi:hypothetical protein
MRLGASGRLHHGRPARLTGRAAGGPFASCRADLRPFPVARTGATVMVAEGRPKMRLTWKDSVSTVFMAAIVIIYVAFLNSTTAWLISSARGTATAVLVLGMIGGCAMSTAAEEYQDPQARAYTGIASLLGTTALVAGVIALITASTVALAILVIATLALWLVATMRHALTPPAIPGATRDTHEVIHQEKVRQ